MSDESYLDRLRQTGEAVDSGQFDVDAEKAREKLQKFRLADPHRYVLQFVQAAHLLGASWIDIEIDADEVEMWFDGAPLPREGLRDVDSAVFRATDDDRSRAVRQLAIGLMAAREVDPARIVVTSEDSGDDGFRLVVGDDGESQLEEDDGPDRGTTRIYLKETFRASHLTEFFHQIGGELVEERLLREECRFSSIPVEVDGERVSDGLSLAEETVAEWIFESDRERGVIGFRDPESVPWEKPVGRLRIVQHGVSVTEQPLRGRGVLRTVAPYAVVTSDRLTRDLSENDIVRDEAWHDLIRRVVPDALVHCVDQFIADLNAYDIGTTYSDWLQRLAMDVWSSEAALSSEAEGELADTLRALRIWPVAWRPDADDETLLYDGRLMMSLEDLREDGTILCARTAVSSDVEPPFDQPVLAINQIESDWRGELAAEARDVTEELKQAERRKNNRNEWESRTAWHPPNERRCPNRYEADDGPYERGVYLSGSEAGPSGGSFGRGRCALVYVKQDKKFAHRRLEDLRLPDGELVVAGDLPIDATWERVVVDEEIRESLFDLAAVLPTLVGESPAGPAFLARRLDADLLPSLLEGLGLEGSADEVRAFGEWLEGSDHGDELSTFWTFSASELDRDEPVSAERLRNRLGPYAHIPLFGMLSGEKRSVADIAEMIAAGEDVRRVEIHPEAGNRIADGGEPMEHEGWVDDLRSAMTFDDWQYLYDRADLDRPFLACTEAEEAILDHCFASAIDWGARELRKAAARARFLDEAPPVARLEEVSDLESVDEEGFELEIGLTREIGPSVLLAIDSEFEHGRVDLEIACKGRRLANRQLTVPAGRFSAVARGEALEADDRWRDVVEDASYRRVVRCVREIAWEKVRRYCDSLFEERGVLGSPQMEFWRALADELEENRFSDWRDVAAFEIDGDGWKCHQTLSLFFISNDHLHYVRGERPILESALTDDRAHVLRVPETDTDALEDLLERLFSVERAIDVTDTSERRDSMVRQESEFREKPTRPVAIRPDDMPADADSALLEADIDIDRMSGQMALLDGGGEDSHIRTVILHERRDLTTKKGRSPFGRWIVVCSAEWISPTPDFRAVRDGENRLQRKLRAFAGELFEELVERVDGADLDRRCRERSLLAEALGRLPAVDSVTYKWEPAVEALEACEMFELVGGGQVSPRQLRGRIEEADGRLYLRRLASGEAVEEARLEATDVPALTGRGFDGEVEKLKEAIVEWVDGVAFVGPEELRVTSDGSEPPSEERGEESEMPERHSALAERVMGRLAEVCGTDHPLHGAIPNDRIVFVETADGGIEIAPDGLHWNPAHPAVGPLLARIDTAGEGVAIEDVIEPILVEVAVSSLYTALSDEIGRSSAGDDVGFYVEHLRAVARSSK